MTNRIVFPRLARKLFGEALNYQGKVWRIARQFSERYDQPLDLPKHVKNYMGRLTLADTAALISQAGYVIGNDSGLTHLAVALGKLTFVVIGPTSRRKVFPSFLKNVHVISLSYDCQPCQENPGLNVWRESVSQCFCPHRIRCMNDLQSRHVMEVVNAQLQIGCA